MHSLAILLFCLFLVTVVRILRATLQFLTFLGADQDGCSNSVERSSTSLPKVAVVLSVRGSDPVLADCVTALLQQDYPNYAVRIVIDSREEPAWQTVSKVIEQFSPGEVNIELTALEVRRPTCSLKCSALVQAIANLNPSFEVIAVLDADVVAHPGWLKALVRPLLQDQDIGVTSGIRWYAPADWQYGSLVRYLWNVSSAVSMYVFDCPWGGSMAIRRSVFDQGKLLETWSQALSDDNTAATAAKSINARICYTPDVIMVNRECCDLSSCWRFVKRQFLWTKLYHPQWFRIIFQVWFRVAVLAGAMLLMPILFFNQQWELFQLVGFGVGLYMLTVFLAWILLENAVREKVSMYGESMGKNILKERPLKAILSLCIAHGVTLAGAIFALGMKSVEWRGITYKIQSPFQVELLGYNTYQGRTQVTESNISIL